ncbi:MAG TPA: hypothetical protein VMU87_19115 [Stellaceae bacterium]|nr:hypothetical protein [Stellaceae bacterium]
MNRIALAVLVAAAGPALAAPPPGAVTIAPGGRVAIAKPPCAALMAGAAYVPGIDSAGNAVAPADLPQAPTTVAPADLPHAVSAIDPGSIAIELDARLAARFGAGVAGARLGKAVLGTITVRDGRAYFNGKPLAADANDAVIAACRGKPR